MRIFNSVRKLDPKYLGNKMIEQIGKGNSTRYLAGIATESGITSGSIFVFGSKLVQLLSGYFKILGLLGIGFASILSMVLIAFRGRYHEYLLEKKTADSDDF